MGLYRTIRDHTGLNVTIYESRILESVWSVSGGHLSGTCVWRVSRGCVEDLTRGLGEYKVGGCLGVFGLCQNSV